MPPPVWADAAMPQAVLLDPGSRSAVVHGPGREVATSPIVGCAAVTSVSAGDELLAAVSRHMRMHLQPDCHVLIAADEPTAESIDQSLLNRASVVALRTGQVTSATGGSGQNDCRSYWLLPGRLLILSLNAAAPEDIRQALLRAFDRVRSWSEPPPNPARETLALALRDGTAAAQAYLDLAIHDLPAIIRRLCHGDRRSRSQVGDLLAVLNFAPGIPLLIERLGHEAERALDASGRARFAADVELEQLCADTFLYLAFELSPRDIGLHLVPAFSRLKESALAAQDEWPLLCRGLRHSFLKGLALLQALPALEALLARSSTDNAAAFGMLRMAVEPEDRRRPLSAAEAHWLVRRLMAFKPRTLLRLARDLRRIVPRSCAGASDHSALYVDAMEQQLAALDQAPDREVWLARCLLLLQTHSAGPAFVAWVQARHEQLGLRRTDRDSLCAVAGYDLPYVMAVNGRLAASKLTSDIGPPSQHESIRNYMTATLGRWSGQPDPLKEFVSRTAAAAPMVTVVLTTFRPDLELLALSLRSVIQQRYPSLEVIVIDDGSAADMSDRVEACVESLRGECAHRLVFHRAASNQGQYQCRNQAIAMANGSFIAIQDDDDLSHPDRIRIQVEPMLRNPGIMASHARHLRIAEESRLMIDGEQTGEIEGDAPVSFIWRAEVFREIGNFLPTRSRGDIEFRARLRRRYGDQAIAAIGLPLVLMRGGLETTSSTHEYFHHSAVSAFRFMMDHTGDDSGNGAGDEHDLQRWIPTNLR
jgi:hypothetical protein